VAQRLPHTQSQLVDFGSILTVRSAWLIDLSRWAMFLLLLPPELVIITAQFLEDERDINSLCRTSRKLYGLLNRYLYCINAQNSTSALILAAIKGSEAIARISIQQGGDVEVTDHSGRNLISLAAQNGHDTVVRLLLETGKVDRYSRDNWDRTPLLHAAVGGHEKVVKLLLENRNVDVDYADFKGRTP
jgi:ankyrin repeat protein